MTATSHRMYLWHEMRLQLSHFIPIETVGLVLLLTTRSARKVANHRYSNTNDGLIWCFRWFFACKIFTHLHSSCALLYFFKVKIALLDSRLPMHHFYSVVTVICQLLSFLRSTDPRCSRSFCGFPTNVTGFGLITADSIMGGLAGAVVAFRIETFEQWSNRINSMWRNGPRCSLSY